MNTCPKCNNSTVIKVTTQNKSKRTRERRGLVWAILTAPFRLIRWFYRYLFLGSEQQYHKETKWRCNNCAHMWRDADADAAQRLAGTAGAPLNAEQIESARESATNE